MLLNSICSSVWWTHLLLGIVCCSGISCQLSLPSNIKVLPSYAIPIISNCSSHHPTHYDQEQKSRHTASLLVASFNVKPFTYLSLVHYHTLEAIIKYSHHFHNFLSDAILLHDYPQAIPVLSNTAVLCLGLLLHSALLSPLVSCGLSASLVILPIHFLLSAFTLLFTSLSFFTYSALICLNIGKAINLLCFKSKGVMPYQTLHGRNKPIKDHSFPWRLHAIFFFNWRRLIDCIIWQLPVKLTLCEHIRLIVTVILPLAIHVK